MRCCSGMAPKDHPCRILRPPVLSPPVALRRNHAAKARISAPYVSRHMEVMMTAPKTPAPAPAAAPKKVPANANRKHEFKTSDHVVYPTHGVGKITKIEEQEV